MSNDVGRNDPCPCGSGAKYKHCCLRKETGSSDATGRTRPDWHEQFEQHFEANRWIDAWQTVEAQAEPGDQSLTDLEERLGYPPVSMMRSLIKELVSVNVRVAEQHPDLAGEAVEFLDGVIDQFQDLDPDVGFEVVRGQIVGLIAGEQYTDALELMERLSELRPQQDWMIEMLRQHPRLQEEYSGPLDGSYNTPKGRDEWDDFWEAFPGAGRDESLDMIETQLRDGSYFDDEWIGSALLESFEEIVDTPERAERWRGLVELTRQKYPEQIGYLEEDLIVREVDAAARYDMDLQKPLDRLFESPIERIDMIGDLIPRLAYAGRPEDMTSRLREAAEGLEPDTSSDFLDRAAWCAPYAWGCERANVNLDTVPDSDEIDEVLGPMAEHVRPRIRERIIGAFRGFFGDVQAPDPHDEASFDTIGLRFGRQLVKSGGRSSPWPAPKAFYASIMLQMLIDAQVKHPPNQRQTTTYGDGKKIDQIRGHLQDASPLLPDPGFAANRVRDAELVVSSRLGHGSAMAAQIIIEWLHFLRDYDLGVSKMVIKSIARHLPPALPGLNQYGWFANRDLTEDMNDAFSSLDSV
jgi:hypothetical protein